VRERATKAARTSESETAGEAARREPGQIPESHELWKDDKWLYELPEYLRVRVLAIRYAWISA
jgi:hypothetical protein